MVAPLLLGVAAAIAAGVAIAKLVDAERDADQSFSTCPVGSSTQTCPAKPKAFPAAEAAASGNEGSDSEIGEGGTRIWRSGAQEQ
jgi:hypothetical protein